MNTYNITDHVNDRTVSISIDKLVPVIHKRRYDMQQLIEFFNNQNLEPDWETRMLDEYELLYERHDNKKYDFFKDPETQIIFVPGEYLYPTILTEQNIIELDSYQQIKLDNPPNLNAMKNTFFQQMALLNLSGNLLLTISKGVENQLIVSVKLDNQNCGDDAKHIIIPYTLKALPEELDEGFFEKIATPLQITSGIMDNMESFMKQTEEAQKQSALEKQKTTIEQKEKDSKDKKYHDGMAKAKALENEGRFREAWSALPKTADFPQHADEIRAKKEICERQFAPDLFTNTDVNP